MHQIAEALGAQSPELMDTQPELFAQHYAEAALIEKSVAYWAKAGRRSFARSAVTEATAQFQKALDELAILPDAPERLDLSRFRGEMRAWDQALRLYVMLSSGSWHSLVRPRRSHSSVPTRALTRLPRAVAVKDGRFLRPPEGLVLDGREHGGRLVCVAIDGCCMMPVFVVNR
jgi:hypothetical protein